MSSLGKRCPKGSKHGREITKSLLLEAFREYPLECRQAFVEGQKIWKINFKHFIWDFSLTGASVVQAAEAAALTAAQEAKRAAFAAQEMMRSAKEAAEKAKRARQIAEAVKTSWLRPIRFTRVDQDDIN